MRDAVVRSQACQGWARSAPDVNPSLLNVTRMLNASVTTAMRDEWVTAISGDRLVKFTHVDLGEGAVFLTAQIAGHEVVYSIISQTDRPLGRVDVERCFDYELRPISN